MNLRNSPDMVSSGEMIRGLFPVPGYSGQWASPVKSWTAAHKLEHNDGCNCQTLAQELMDEHKGFYQIENELSAQDDEALKILEQTS